MGETVTDVEVAVIFVVFFSLAMFVPAGVKGPGVGSRVETET